MFAHKIISQRSTFRKAHEKAPVLDSYHSDGLTPEQHIRGDLKRDVMVLQGTQDKQFTTTGGQNTDIIRGSTAADTPISITTFVCGETS